MPFSVSRPPGTTWTSPDPTPPAPTAPSPRSWRRRAIGSAEPPVQDPRRRACRTMAQEHINEVMVDRTVTGRFVVRLKGGDPYLFGCGFEEVSACAKAGVPVTVVPGVNSAPAAPALAGIPVAQRGMAQEVTIVSGHVPPITPAASSTGPLSAGSRARW
ncbi:SAM-dependent methyltransferase [Streptomyces sp. NPDC005356]|uniref:SAM-dependent methyltransferase n=1 Tax=unclassified Streptomyces TaxID=2593676 RepID=UPI0033A884F7